MIPLKSLCTTIIENYVIRNALIIDHDSVFCPVLEASKCCLNVFMDFGFLDCNTSDHLAITDYFKKVDEKYDLAYVNFGSVEFKHYLYKYLSDTGTSFIIGDSTTPNIRKDGYTLIRFTHREKEMKLYYLDVLRTKLGSLESDPYYRFFNV